jgi:hypothetical protein
MNPTTNELERRPIERSRWYSPHDLVRERRNPVHGSPVSNRFLEAAACDIWALAAVEPGIGRLLPRAIGLCVAGPGSRRVWAGETVDIIPAITRVPPKEGMVPC